MSTCEHCRNWKKYSWTNERGECNYAKRELGDYETYSDDSCKCFKTNALPRGLKFDETGDLVRE